MIKLLCQNHSFPISQLPTPTQALLICEECLVNLLDDEKQYNFENVIFLKKAFNNPAYLLSKTSHKKIFSQFLQYIQQFDENQLKLKFTQLEKSIKAIQKSLELLTEEIKNQIQLITQMRQNTIQQLKKVIKFEQFQQLIQTLGLINDNVDPDYLHQIEYKLFQYLNTVSNEQNENIKQQITQIIQNNVLQKQKGLEKQKDRHNDFLQQVEEFNQQQNQFISSSLINYETFMNGFYNSTLIIDQYRQKLKYIIEQKTQKIIFQTQLIFQGNREGLNNDKFWGKVKGKNNLIMIFKTKSEQVFGAFSPCQWIKNQNNFIQDDSLASFIFDITQNQFYSLNQNDSMYAIFCSSNYGPTFGRGNDLCISSDFSSATIRIGSSFQLDQEENVYYQRYYQQSNYSKIRECEIDARNYCPQMAGQFQKSSLLIILVFFQKLIMNCKIIFGP